jgi:hypothetical protein
MPSPYQVMEMVMRHFPNAELVEHLPIQQGFVNAMLNNSTPISTTGFVCEFRIPVAGNNVIKVIAKIDWHGNCDWTVYEWEVMKGGE